MTETFAVIGTDFLLALAGILSGMVIGWWVHLSERNTFFWHIVFAAICIVGMIMLMQLIFRMPFVTNNGISIYTIFTAWTSGVVALKIATRKTDASLQ